jgi:hypothetical protein
VDDPDHLYAPGKVVAMYGTMAALPAKGEIPTVVIKAAIIEPSNPMLRQFDIGKTMFSDHFIQDYKDSMSACLETK